MASFSSRPGLCSRRRGSRMSMRPPNWARCSACPTACPDSLPNGSVAPCREGLGCRPGETGNFSCSCRGTRPRSRLATSSSVAVIATSSPDEEAIRSSSAGPRSFPAGSRMSSAACPASPMRGPTASPTRSPARSSPRRSLSPIRFPTASRRRISARRRWRPAAVPSSLTACHAFSTSPGSWSRIRRAKCRVGRSAKDQPNSDNKHLRWVPRARLGRRVEIARAGRPDRDVFAIWFGGARRPCIAASRPGPSRAVRYG